MKKKLSPKETRFIRIFYAIAGIAIGIYSWINNVTLAEKNLKKIEITISKLPTYEQHTVKGTTYYNLSIYTKESIQPFEISGWVYKSIDHKKIKKLLVQNQKMWIKIDENDLYKSNKETIEAWGIGIHKETLSDPYYINTKIEKEKHFGTIAFLFGVYNIIYLFFDKKIKYNYKYGTYVFYALIIVAYFM